MQSSYVLWCFKCQAHDWLAICAFYDEDDLQKKGTAASSLTKA